MAAKERLPSCTVCQMPYVYDTRGPFLLPCLHSVCENCLKTESDRTLLCGTCQETFPKSSFPIDAVTRKEILLSTTVHNTHELLCTNREDGNQAMSWCQECEAFLCEHCQVAHGDMKATRKHKVILVQDLPKFPQTLKGMPYCHQHSLHPVTFHDSSCNVPLCAMCVLTEHVSCKTEDIETAWNTHRTFLEDKAVTLTAKLDRLMGCRTLQRDIGQSLKLQQDAVEEVIRYTFKKLHLMLDQREQELKIEVNESTKFLTHRSDQQLLTLEGEVDKVTQNLDFIQKLNLLSYPVEHFAMMDTIDNRTMAVAESELPRVKSQEYSFTFSRDGPQRLQQQISSLGGLFTNRIGAVPPLKMDKTRLNTDLVHIRDDEILIHGKQFQQERSHGSFRNYSGTISCHPLTQSDIQYWEVKVFLEPFQNPGGLLLFETGACVQASIDDGETACGNVHSFVMFAALCDVHRGICVQSRKHGRDTTCLQNVLENTEGAATDLWYGFLFNPMEGSVSIVDVKSGCVLVQLTHMETGLEYWPVFGVFNGHLAKVHMSLVSGVNITFDGHKKRWMQSALG
ncbi:protein PML-like isoform X2 [Haliotis rufescens]|uniref:protein PML-like isoform X2 n=1 Tax=Haliotis rufescens TaxID=6454 RepID=UPI00201F61BE|nr:protein PML-like isoform X2 [Haliotis rufescens]